MYTYNFLVAVVREGQVSISTGMSIFLAGMSAMFVIAMIILYKRPLEAANDKLETLEKAE